MTTARRASAMPVLVAAVVYGLATRSALFVVGMVVVMGLALLVAPRLAVSRFVQRAVLVALAIFGAVGGAGLVTSLAADVSTRPPELLGRVAVTALALGATRRFFAEPDGGARVDFALGAAVVVACGQRHLGAPYAVAVVGFVAASVIAFRTRGPELPFSALEAKAPLAALGVVVGTALGAYALSAAIPRIARLTERQFERYVFSFAGARVGFTERLGTGTTEELVESSTLVLRVYGPHVDYLRGRVYDTFDGWAWGNGAGPLPKTVDTAIDKPAGKDVREIRGVGALARADAQARFFLPLGARTVATPRGKATADRYGILRPEPDDPPTPVAFDVGDPEYPEDPPGPADRDVPEGLRPVLLPLVVAWTADVRSPREKLTTLERRLAHDFAYTTHAIPLAHEPPVVTFLLRTRVGRCELFATALALLARTAGVPARVVGGFRVAEHNDVGGYDVVREKNAHAWVEAWVADADGHEAWRTFDATPATEANFPRDERGPSAALDAALAAWDRALELLGRASLWQFGLLLVGAVALLVFVRTRRQRRERGAEWASHAAGAALEGIAVLERALAARGIERAPDETLEGFAARLRAAGQASAAAVFVDYGAYRYGDVGDAALLSDRARRSASSLAATTTRA